MILAFLVIYSAALVALGLFVSRRVTRSSDFFVAGRQLSPALLFSTFLAANLGAGTTVGAAEFGYRHGLSAWWWVGSAGIGSLILGLFIGPRIYRIASEHNLYTIGDYLELRYSRAVRYLMAALLWLGSLAILAAQLIALGLVLNVVAGLPPHWGTVLGGVLVTVYFTAGGLLSSAWVNLVQVAVKAAGFCLAVPWALSGIGGWEAIPAAVEQNPSLATESYLSFTGLGAAGILRYAVILIPSFIISPGLIQKLYGAREESVVRSAVGAQGIVLLAYSFLPVILGMAAMARFPQLENPALALPKLLAEGLPVWLGGLMLAAIFSAEVSSADAVLFMLTTSVSRDFVQTALRRGLTDAGLLRVTRATAVVAGAAGIVLALWLQSILAALEIFYSLLAVSLFVPLLAGLYSTGPKAGAALAAMAASVPATAAIHLLTRGAGFGALTPASLGILFSAAVFFLFAMRKNSTAPV
jgi:SSS family solute:Na+ symporter